MLHALAYVLFLRMTMKETYCPVVYASSLLNRAKKNHSVTDLEALVVIWALKKFRYLIHGSKFQVLIDQISLVYLFLGEDLPRAMAHWLLMLQDFMPNFTYIQRQVIFCCRFLSPLSILPLTPLLIQLFSQLNALTPSGSKQYSF